MRELTAEQKGMVIKLFLEGCSYDEIASKLGIAKGSITNIVEEARSGNLPLAVGFAEYVDDLRKIAVDIKKNNTSVSELMPCLTIHDKLKRMGVSNQQIDLWIDICRHIATDDVPNRQFVEATLELARLMSKTEMSYESLIDDYTKKSKELESNQVEIEKCKNQIDELRDYLTSQRKHNKQSIQSMKKELATAIENHNKSLERMQADLDKHLTENKLSWEKVDTVIAVLDKELSKADLTQEQIHELSKKIAATGHLSTTISQKEMQSKELSSELENLSAKMEQTKEVLHKVSEEYTNVDKALNSEVGCQ